MAVKVEAVNLPIQPDKARKRAQIQTMAKEQKYILVAPALGLPAGAVIDGPGAEVLANNGKAVPAPATEAKPARKKKEGAK